MAKRQRKKDDELFYQVLTELADNHYFLSFDTFLIQQMGFAFENKTELEDVRRKAFLEFRKQTKHYEFATLPTLRKWFGIGGVAKPKREQVFEIALILGLNREILNEYLTLGLGEVPVQISDYREIIYLYGLENQLSLETCEKMVRHYEANMAHDVPYEHEAVEDELWEQYEVRKMQGKQEFMIWMLTKTEKFKGYSWEVMENIYQLRRNVLIQVRREAKERLDSLLAETDYEKWAKSRRSVDSNEREIIKKYVGNRRHARYYKTSKNMGDNIIELSKLAYSELEANSRVLAEVFVSSKRRGTEGKQRIMFQGIRSMTAKHLSDLFNIPLQKERAMRACAAWNSMDELAAVDSCPQWIVDMYTTYTRGTKQIEDEKEAKTWLQTYIQEQRRRCVHICRNDILPMVHYVAQHLYTQELLTTAEAYDRTKARRQFVSMANRTLKSCGMAPVDKKFEMDAVLLTCFQPEEMYSYTEVLDMVEGK
nr:hypothetical protein [Eubacterium sp.]